MAWDSKKINEYAKENYDRIAINVPKGEKERIKGFAKKNGLSVTDYILCLLENDRGKMLEAAHTETEMQILRRYREACKERQIDICRILEIDTTI